jgi:hypothetical protein
MPFEESIETTEPVETPAPPAKDDKATKDETVTLTKAEVEALRRDRDEARESERYWSQIARQGGRQQAEPAEEPAEQFDGSEFMDEKALDGIDGDTPEKLVDDFAAKGVAALKSRGFITAADAQKLAVEVAAKVSREMIGRERQKITTDTQIMTEFPDLRDQNSDLFKETAKRYQRAVAMDPGAAKTPAALYLAAEAAREALKARKPAAPARREDDYEEEGDRRARAASQDSRPRGRAEVDDQEDMLGDEARQVIKQMGITEEEYKASQKQVYGGRSRGRR